MSFQIGRMSDGLKRASDYQISEYEQSFQSVSGLYDRFLSDMIIQGVDSKKANARISKIK